MRKIIMMAVTIIFFLTPNYSQHSRPLNLYVPEFKLPIESHQNLKVLDRSFSYKDFKQAITPNKNSVPLIFMQKSLPYKFRLNETAQSSRLYDNMPCIKPSGYYPAYTYLPDSSERYSLLLKRLK